MHSKSSVCCAGFVLAGFVTTACAQLRIVNYNVAQLNGNLASLQDVLTALGADDKPGFAVAPHILIFQEVQNPDTSLPTPMTSPLGARITAAFPGVPYARATYTSTSSEESTVGAQCIYFRSDTLAEIAGAHLDLATGASRNSDRWQFRLLGYNSLDARFYVYSSHLKAGTAAADETERFNGAVVLRNNADLLPAGSHVIYAGDYNVYDNGELAYQEMISAGNGQAVDPFGTGNWTGVGNAIKHTQSPCATGCALVGGGMDDRFDLQLATSAFNDGEGLARIVGTYRSLGNDGNHYNLDINSGNNTYYPADIPRSNALASDLKVASDHVPVICEYQVPAKMDGALPASFGRVIQNSTVTVQLQVSNTAAALVTSGADELDFAATASGGLSGTAGGIVNALAVPALRAFDVDTSTVGPVSGSVNLTSSSQGVEPAALAFNASGSVVRAANASFAAALDQNSLSTYRILPANGGIVALPAIQVFNFGYDANQALLDVDSVDGATPPFQFTNGLASGIGAGSAALEFSVDTTAVGSVLLTSALQIHVSDEDIPGQSTSDLSLSIEVRVRPVLGDVDNDCDCDLTDLTALLGAFGTCTAEAGFNRECDLDNSGCVDLGDLTTLLADFGSFCP
jgi:exonuclease III